MKIGKRIFVIFMILASAVAVQAEKKPFKLDRNESLRIECAETAAPVLKTALGIFGKDIGNVLDIIPEISPRKGKIIVGTAQDLRNRVKGADAELDSIDGRREAFAIKVLPDGRLMIGGSDYHGVAYGVLELSRKLGVSPWEWWADATPAPMAGFTLPAGYSDIQEPSVEYRGIFINDEDWGLMPWSGRTYEPGGEPGRIGPATNEKIFELMLRLRANTYWPAMHECSIPFFLTDGNREVAEKYGIYIGGSHCEPMACSAAGEWPRRGVGEYNYVSNRDEVIRFWENRVKEVAKQEILYTLGMRGVHDSAMKGAKTAEEGKAILNKVFDEQRNLLRKHVNADATQVPQVFIPYKEVLDIYNAGLEVPEDVALMWCDDNYGYIRHFPTEAERSRKGGNGVYYHVSYWGRPHDYLWLGTFSPYLLYQQMSLAYDRGIQKIWILNVGDIKPAEYQIELFLDMAWDMDQVRRIGPEKHLREFLGREFGEKQAQHLTNIMNEHYRLAYIRKPEHMGNTRTEEARKAYFSTIRDLDWGKDSLLNRRNEYMKLSAEVENIGRDIPSDRQDTYFQLIKYPVQCAALMNKKFIDAQMARHRLADWRHSDEAYDSIATLTRIYNEGINNKGKWRGIMDMAPRKLPVFARVPHSTDSVDMAEPGRPAMIFNGINGIGRFTPCENLGYGGGAVAVAKGDEIAFDIPATINGDSITVDVRLLPSHPVEGSTISFNLLMDGKPIGENINFATQGRSEEWKLNVMSNQAIRKFRIRNDGHSHRISILPMTHGVVLDQMLIWHDGNI